MTAPPSIPGYAVERLLGEGAYGRVYLAREEGGLERPVALKVFAAQHREHYERELAMVRRIEEVRRREQALGICQALGSGEHGDLRFIALELVEGGSLQDRIERDGPLGLDAALDCVTEAGEALCLLHAEGVFHRDVKPANLLLGSDGRVRLADFGLTRSLSGTLSAAGSPAFAAPEVIAGRPTDGRLVDVYSLGATLSFLLAGETMLPGRPDVFALERRGVPRALQHAIVAATAADPTERLGSMDALLERLREARLGGAEENPRTYSGSPDGASEGADAAPATEATEQSETDMQPSATGQPITYDDLTQPEIPRMAPGATKSLVCALLVWPLLLSWSLIWLSGSSVEMDTGPVGSITTSVVRSPEEATSERTGFVDDGPRDKSLGGREGPRQARKTRGSSFRKIVGLVIGVSLMLSPLIAEILAFVFGLRALALIRASGGRLAGRGMAKAGVWIASLNLALPILLVLLRIVLVLFQPAPMPA